MSLKTLEESIREYSTYQLEEVISEKRKDYSEEAVDIAEDELIFRKLLALPPIVQVDFIKSLPNQRISNAVNKYFKRYTPTLLMIIQTEYSKRELEVPEWYYLDINKPVGPLKLNDLKKLVENGSIFPFTLVCKLGTQSWIDAGSIPGLFILSNTNIPTLPQIPTNFNYNNHQSINNEIEDNPELGCILSIICFWVPIIGIIVFFIEKNEKGRNALLLALAGIVINLLIYSFLI